MRSSLFQTIAVGAINCSRDICTGGGGKGAGPEISVQGWGAVPEISVHGWGLPTAFIACKYNKTIIHFSTTTFC